MNAPAFFEIQSSEPEKSIEFYSAIFGWHFTKQEGLPIPYWHIETEGIRGGLLQRPAKVPPQGFGTNAYVCSMQVQNFDTTAKKILDQGGIVALEKFAVPGKCWQGYFIDTNNNTFGIFEVDEKAA